MCFSTAIKLVLLCSLVLSSCAKAQRLENSATPPISKQNNQITSIPVDVLLGGGVLLQARVNDSGPLQFALDSGGGSGFIVDLRRAKSLGLRFEGKSISTGAGERSVDVVFANNVLIKLPGAEFPSQTIAVIALDPLEPFSGLALDGIIGYGLFSRYIVEIDYAAHRVNLYNPQSYYYSGSGTRLPLTLEKAHFFVPVKVVMAGRRPVAAKLMIDTGAPTTTITLNRPFVERYDLLTVFGGRFLDRSLPGLGGEVKQVLSRASEFELGDLRIRNPTITLAQDAAGSLANSDFDGIIGGELLRRFKVIFDTAHNQLILEPNAHFAEPYEHNMSGIGLRAEGKDFKTIKIYRIIADSPAAQAGLREGDEIMSIDGNPAFNFTLDKLYQMFKQEGREYVFSILRIQKKLQIKIKLRRLV
jgi:hypothetical protein